MKIRKKILIVLTVVLLFVVNTLSFAKVDLSEYISSNELLYFETVSLSQLNSNLVDLALKIRGEKGKLEIHLLGKKVKSALGFNPFKISDLKSKGIDVNSSLVGSVELTKRKKIHYSVLIPTFDSNKAFSFIKNIFQKDVNFVHKRNKSRPSYRKSKARLIDVEPGKIIQYIFKKNQFSATTNIFVARKNNFLIIADDRIILQKSMNKSSNSIKNTLSYKKIKNEFESNYNKSGQYFFFVFNKTLLNTKKINNSNILGIDEIEKNTLAYGGYWGIKKKSIEFTFNSIFRPEYIQNHDGLLNKLLKYKKQKLLIDFLDKNPVFYSKLKFNFPFFIDFLDKMSKSFHSEMQLVDRHLQKYNISFKEDVLKALNGNFSLLLRNIQLEKPDDPASYEAYFNFSMNTSKMQKFKKFLSILPKQSNSKLKIKKRRQGRGEIWEFSISFPAKRNRYNKKRKKLKPKVRKIYFYFEKDYGFITTQRKFVLKALSAKRKMINSRNSAFENILRNSNISENTNFLLHIEMNKVIKLINTSPFLFLVNQYLTFFEKIKAFQMLGAVKENISFSQFRILLK